MSFRLASPELARLLAASILAMVGVLAFEGRAEASCGDYLAMPGEHAPAEPSCQGEQPLAPAGAAAVATVKRGDEPAAASDPPGTAGGRGAWRRPRSQSSPESPPRASIDHPPRPGQGIG